MGNWGCYQYADGAWESFGSPDEVPDSVDGRSLRLFLADSALAEVRHLPLTAPASAAFVGHTPRSYFDDPQAPGCTDPTPAATALATWAGNDVTPEQVAPLLAVDGQQDADPTVEETLDRLVAVLGLPPVPW